MIKTEEPEKISAGSAMATSGWWLGFGGGKALALPFVQLLQEAGIVNAWQSGYLALTVIVILCIMGVIFFIRVPGGPSPPPPTQESMALRAVKLYANPLMSFVRRYTLSLAILLLFFIFFFKIGEAFFGTYVAGVLQRSRVHQNGNWFTLRRFGHYHGMRFFHFRQFRQRPLWATERAFLGRYRHGRNQPFLGRTGHLAEQRIICRRRCRRPIYHRRIHRCFVAFLSQLCDRAYTATQYAALASIGNLSRTTLAAASGFIVDGLGGNWAIFFVLNDDHGATQLGLAFYHQEAHCPLDGRRDNADFVKTAEKDKNFTFFCAAKRY